MTILNFQGRVFRSLISTLVVGLLVAVTAPALAEQNSNDHFGTDYARYINDRGKNGLKYSEINCPDTYVATIADGVTAKSNCVRYTSDVQTDAVGNYYTTYDFRVVRFQERMYVLGWRQLHSGARIYSVEIPPKDIVGIFGSNWKRMLTNWTAPRRYSAGFTRQFQGATADHSSGECLVLTGKRGKRSVLSVLTCGENLPARAELKIFLKSFN